MKGMNSELKEDPNNASFMQPSFLRNAFLVMCHILTLKGQLVIMRRANRYETPLYFLLNCLHASRATQKWSPGQVLFTGYTPVGYLGWRKSPSTEKGRLYFTSPHLNSTCLDRPPASAALQVVIPGTRVPSFHCTHVEKTQGDTSIQQQLHREVLGFSVI